MIWRGLALLIYPQKLFLCIHAMLCRHLRSCDEFHPCPLVLRNATLSQWMSNLLLASCYVGVSSHPLLQVWNVPSSAEEKGSQMELLPLWGKAILEEGVFILCSCC
jgi:hypothetical protein